MLLLNVINMFMLPEAFTGTHQVNPSFAPCLFDLCFLLKGLKVSTGFPNVGAGAMDGMKNERKMHVL
jgi:hypothetical protein